MMFNLIKSYYSRGLWSDSMVRMAVRLNRISAEEYKDITGQDY